MLDFVNSDMIAFALSFLSGMVAYIVVFFWIKPIVKYVRLKKQIRNDLKPYTENDSEADPAKIAPDQIDGWAERHERYAQTVSDAFTKQIPFWYKILLAHRKELPMAASEQLAKMATIHKLEPAKRCAQKIKELLRLK